MSSQENTVRSRPVVVALAGNPNSGKTTVFNAITGTRQHVGNYPGVTVEKKTGRARRGETDLEVVDLPGTYSLTAHSLEEVVARNFILDAKPDVVIDIIDSANLERNLYLAVQLMELGVPLVLAFNMSDLAAGRGVKIDREQLSRLLGVPIVATVGHKGQGIDALVDAALATARDPAGAVERQKTSRYGPELEPEIEALGAMASAKCRRAGRARWVAIKLLEDDPEAVKRLAGLLAAEDLDDLLTAADRSRRHIASVCGDSAEIILADRRYGVISGACQEAVRTTVESRHLLSDRIDAVVTNRVLALPLFLLMMLAVFQFTFSLGNPISGVLDDGKAALAGRVARLWPKDADSALRSLLVDGVIEGVGTVLVFMPLILLLFLAISLLEDSGYMARVAFITDRLMHKIGLHGKSCIPMVIGFGCTVPAIMATRTLENRRDRLTTMLVLPLISCTARLPIYVLVLGAFFPRRAVFSLFGIADVTNQALWLLLMYLIGIALAMAAAQVLRKTLLAGEETSFVMELPPYRAPTLKGALLHTWARGWIFLRKAGTVILAAMIVLWALARFPSAGADPAAQAERDAAESRFLAAASAVGRGLGADEDVFRRLAEADLAVARTRRRTWPDSPDRRDADDAYRQAVGDVAAASPAFGNLLRTGAARSLPPVQTGRSQPPSPPEPWRRRVAASRPAAGAVRAWRAYLDARDGRDAAVRHADELQAQRKLAHAAIGRIGKGIAPIMRPCGFDWKISTALIGAFGAKEIFVGQMAVVHAVGQESEDARHRLKAKLQAQYSPLQGFCIMLFCLISLPCVATVVVTWRESGQVRWALLQMVGLTMLAWAVTTLVFQIGRALGAPVGAGF